MPGKGSCLCGSSTYTFTGEPLMTALCHCLSCRKLTGSTHATAFMLPAPHLTYTTSSPLKSVTVEHELGFEMTITFCSSCGSAMSKVADDERFAGAAILFMGCVDEPKGMLESKPQAEMWTKYRVPWEREVEGTTQAKGFE